MCGIYAIINNVNGKMYIGQSIDIKRRWADEKRQLNKGICHLRFLQAAWNKYGEESFEFKILKEIKCRNGQLIAILNKWEEYYITYYNTIIPGCGYNLKFGGNNYTITDEVRERLSESQKGKKLTKETKEKIGRYWKGKKPSRETIEKIRAAKMGKNNHFYGQTLTEEHKRKISKALIGRVFSEKHRERLSIANKGKKLSEETKEKLRAINKGRHIGNKYFLGKKHSEETRGKISLFQKGRKKSKESIKKREETKRRNRSLKLLDVREENSNASSMRMV